MKAWLTLKSVGNNKAPDELARAVLHLAMEGERAPVRLHDGSLGRTATRCRLARGELIVA
jgi:hypothetical protein